MRARLLSLILLLATYTPTLFAQTNLDACATMGRSEWIDAYQSGKIKPVAKSLELRYVPVHLTIVGDDNGDGYGDPLTILKSFELLNEDFAAIDVSFFIENDIDYLNSSDYFDHDFDVGYELMRNNNRPNTVNSYIVGNPAGACGYYSGSGDGIALGVNCINAGDRTWSHEVGHYLGLPHTFYGWESVGDIAEVEAFDKPAPDSLKFNGRTVLVERVDQSNCEDAADGFCDTAPDYLPERWRCGPSGIYPDSLLDPDSTRFVVQAKNIMSYAFDGCVDQFSPEQITAMNTNLDGRIGLPSRSIPEFAAARGEDLTLISPAPNESVEYSDSVLLVWNSVPNADFYLVQLNINENFNGTVFTSFFTSDTSAAIVDILSPNGRYYWRVRPINRFDVSGTFSDFQRFRNGSVLSSVRQDADLATAISVAPNPVAGQSDLRITGTRTGGGDLSIQLIDAAGRIVKQAADPRAYDDFTVSVPTEGLLPGMYFVRLTLDGRLATRRVVITP